MKLRKGGLSVIALLLFVPMMYLILTSTNFNANKDNVSIFKMQLSSLLGTNTTDRPIKIVFLVTYGRSGSTFTASLLSSYPNTFYFFEPLRALLLRCNKGLDVINGFEQLGGTYKNAEEIPNLSDLTKYERKAVDMLDDIINCDISKYPVADYRDVHFHLHGDTAAVENCLASMTDKQTTYLDLDNYLQCLLKFQQKCLISSLRLFKIIRLPIRALFSLLQTYEDLAVVYLTRDPRAILQSQRALFGHSPSPQNFCRSVVDDCQHIQLLKSTFPNRAFAVRYEDIAQDPISSTRQLYGALGLELTSNILNNVRRMTSAKRNDTIHDYSTFRQDSMAAANKWRRKARYPAVKSTDAVCKEAYDWLGYRPVKDNQMLKDLKTPLTETSGKVTFLKEEF